MRSSSSASRRRSSSTLFERLISVSGIGPKVALAVLVRHRAGRARARRATGRHRAPHPNSRHRPQDGRAPRAGAEGPTPGRDCRAMQAETTPVGRFGSDDVLSALVNLGYQRAAVEKTVEKVARRSTVEDFEPLLREVLKELARYGSISRLTNALRADDDAQYEIRAAAAHARRLHRAGARPREPAGVDHRDPTAQRGARPRAALRAARPRQDDAGVRDRQRAGRAGAVDVRPGARAAGRPRRDPDQPARPARCSSSTKYIG